MQFGYQFKRSFYYDVIKAIHNQSIVFILGPRKCGKTVCMQQLKAALDNAYYFDMKADFKTDTERLHCVDKLTEDIFNNRPAVYLIDEATYMALPDKEIARIAGAFNELNNRNTKVVFSGSQSKALEFWGHIACGGNAAFIKVDFLTYPEWLAYSNICEVSEQTYHDFLFNTQTFYKDFSNTKEYLQGCLDETVISNRKSIEYIVDNHAEDLTVDMLLDVLYASLVKLHNHTNVQTFSNTRLLETMLGYYFRDLAECEINRIAEFLGERYRNFRVMDGYDCKCAMQFLTGCGLTTLTYLSDTLMVDPYVTEKILKTSNNLYKKPEIFERFNLTLNYPMFFVDLTKNILRDRSIKQIPQALLGSLVECHIRSLLPTNGAFEFHDNGLEIDYVSTSRKQGIEISVANKRLKDVNLQKLPNDYQKILITRDRTEPLGDIQCIPYYQFIFDNSAGTDLMEQLKAKRDNVMKTNLFGL